MVLNKKDVAPEVVRELNKKFSCDLLTSSILARRGVTRGEDVLYYMEDDLRFQHNPFLFSDMEDAVDRILQAKDEGEKVLVFGDRDVDGVTSTTLLVSYLREIGVDVSWQLPSGDEAYGLSMEAVDDFAKGYGTLIITVDCGISNSAEIAHAAELGVDVIIADHHNPPEILPEPAIILDPKLKFSGYPFADISGCAVAYKLVSALRFADSDWYKQELCLLNVRPVTDAYVIECLKVVNLAVKDTLTETIVPGVVKIHETRLESFLQGQHIFVWDIALQQQQLEKIFGKGVEFGMFDVRSEIEKFMPSLSGMSLLKLKDLSKVSKYKEVPADELGGFFNLFVTYVQKQLDVVHPLDLQLVTLAALADIMPLKNENRILVRQGLAAINSGNIHPGLLELMSRLNLLGKHITSKDLSWNVIPVLNAAGRLGQPELAAKLFMDADPKARDTIAQQIIQLNTDRKQLGDDAWTLVEQQAYASLSEYSSNLVVVIDAGINRGITGLLAQRLAQTHKVPAIAVTYLDDGTAVGSMRSVRGVDATHFLEQFAGFFINYGGHNAAAGFSFAREKSDEFVSKLKQLASTLELEKPDDETISVDAELPYSYMTPDILKLVDRFEPFGKENPELQFLVNGATIIAADIIGKGEKKHLKLTLQCGTQSTAYKWPALYWNAAERYNRDFVNGDKVNVVFTLSRNTFNGSETVQMIVVDMEKGA